jgi:regulatory protein YycI of two-component signal transduction system YycFG
MDYVILFLLIAIVLSVPFIAFMPQRQATTINQKNEEIRELTAKVMHLMLALQNEQRMRGKALEQLDQLRHIFHGFKTTPQQATNKQFTQDEIKRLILLCHPDKHQGKQIAHELTHKLLSMRSK